MYGRFGRMGFGRRFNGFGRGFFLPFTLGTLTGIAISRPNYYYYPPYPYPYYY